MNFDPTKDSLKTLSSVAQKKLGEIEFGRFLEQHYLHCSPSSDYNALANYVWKRIYTTNIDDALDNSFKRSSQQNTRVLNRTSPLYMKDSNFEEVHIVKLNGSIDQVHAGLIFSTDEYAKESYRDGTWYQQLAIDYYDNTFVFVGTQLDEPFFYHHVERYSSSFDTTSGTSIIICPSFTDLQKEALLTTNILAIEGTLRDFVEHLEDCVGSEFGKDQIIKENRPKYYQAFSKLSDNKKDIMRKQVNAITVVTPTSFTRSKRPPGVRDFYFGSQPRWADIVEGVPANLESYSKIKKAIDRKIPLVVVHGGAGCGKSTALRKVAYDIGKERGDNSVFYIANQHEFPKDAIAVSCDVSGLSSLIVIDDFEWCSKEVFDLIEKHLGDDVTFLVSDRTVAWSRVRKKLPQVSMEIIRLVEITPNDAQAILIQLEKFGPWGRLNRMTESQRLAEFEKRAKLQLLVALREITEGRRFDEIIEDEYNSIGSDYQKMAFHVCGLATLHRLSMPYETFDWAMSQTSDGLVLPRDKFLEGILVDEDGSLSLRHSVIADHIIRRIVNRKELLDALIAVFSSFARYRAPLLWYASNYFGTRQIRIIEFTCLCLITNSCLIFFRQIKIWA